MVLFSLTLKHTIVVSLNALTWHLFNVLQEHLYVFIDTETHDCCITKCMNAWQGKLDMHLTHCGLVTLYGNIDLGQHWLR